NLMQNFAFPYFSQDIAEFWRRWHISLSTWFRDYVYIPLGGSYVTTGKRIRNVLITFVVSGLWHGANWTFVFWGFLHGLYYVPLMLTGRQRKHRGPVAAGRRLPAVADLSRILLTFLLVLIAWTFFRADTIGDAFAYLAGIVSGQEGQVFQRMTIGLVAVVIAVLLVVEWVQRTRQHGLVIDHLPTPWRWTIYVLLIMTCLLFYGEQQAFIYFQF
ncbi:MAG: MBOAT family O-acyltransferase, partial [Saprospiraceae bacterium]|nr:MBOAT family O-acyltransferase [Saprospiraceae bacterium]